MGETEDLHKLQETHDVVIQEEVIVGIGVAEKLVSQYLDWYLVK